MGVITNKQLVKYARGQLGRMYVYGTYGQTGSRAVYLSKLQQYGEKISKWPYDTYAKGFGQKWHDCAGLVKGAIFCKGVIDAVPVYNCNFDYSANGIIELCEKNGELWTPATMPKDVTGLVMWKPGHMGIWDADTQTTIEAKGHMYGVVETTDTPWQKVGRLPASWVDYVDMPAPDPEPIGGDFDLKVKTLKYDGKKAMKDPNVLLFQSMMNTLKIRDDEGKELAEDSKYGPRSVQACKRFQSKSGLKVDGECGPKTWDKIANG